MHHACKEISCRPFGGGESKMFKNKKEKKTNPGFKYRCSLCGFVATAVRESDIKDGEPCWQLGCEGVMKRMQKGENG